MYTQIEAEFFVKSLLEEIVPNGRVKSLTDFYSPDVIEHCDDRMFNYQDIENKTQSIKDQVTKCKFKVEKVEVFESYIFCLCNQTWIDARDNKAHQVSKLVVYKIKNGKIHEAWLMTDNEFQQDEEIKMHITAQCISNNFSISMLQ